VNNSWSSWWLPENHAVHGHGMDSLFNWIFWITMVAWVLVTVLMVLFMIQYRYRPGVKGKFIHGNTRLEMIWTLVPAFILAVIAFYSKQVWSEIRYADELRDPSIKPAKILIIGEQFKWNVIYPGPDGEFGRYLLFPKATDAHWPDGKKFQGFTGPRDVPPDQAGKMIASYIASSDASKLGKDMSDAKGKDDLWEGSLGRTIEVPVDRPVDLYVGSKDVIHSFSIPSFRLKLDTVPGLLNVISFTPEGKESISAQREVSNRKSYSLDELKDVVSNLSTRDQRIFISEADLAKYGETKVDKDKTGWRFVSTNAQGKKSTIIRDGMPINYDPSSPETSTIAKLKAADITQVTCYVPGFFDVVCQQLCGQGHYTMQGQCYVIDGKTYAEKYEGAKVAAAPSTQPVAAAAH